MFDIGILAENLKKYRIATGIKQYQLAEKLHITPQSVSKWEQGLSVPDVENLYNISEIFGVSIDNLLGKEKINEKYMISVDGGGTKTEMVLFSKTGNIRHRIVLEGTNPNIYGIQKTCEILKFGIDSLMSLVNNVSDIYCGIAGFLSGNNGEKVQCFLNNTYPDVCIENYSDILNVAASVTEKEKCIVVICGTGANVCAINGDKINRVGGWGYLFEGQGSGFDIGRDAITVALAENDGIGPKSLITEYVENKLGCKTWDAINRIYSEDKAYVASFAVQVFEAYRKNDAVASEIIRKNMYALCEKINFAANTYDCGQTVIISGGIVRDADILIKFIKEKLNKNLKILIPSLPQIYGASVLCCKKYGVVNKMFEENFMRDYQKYM